MAKYGEVAKALNAQLAAFLQKQRGEMTLELFSRKLGISVATLNRLEQGIQNTTLATLEQITKRLNCKLKDIFPE